MFLPACADVGPPGCNAEPCGGAGLCACIKTPCYTAALPPPPVTFLAPLCDTETMLSDAFESSDVTYPSTSTEDGTPADPRANSHLPQRALLIDSHLLELGELDVTTKISNVSATPVTCGGASDVFQGDWIGHGPGGKVRNVSLPCCGRWTKRSAGGSQDHSAFSRQSFEDSPRARSLHSKICRLMLCSVIGKKSCFGFSYNTPTSCHCPGCSGAYRATTSLQ